MEDPALTKGMVKREVVQLITPGTQIDTGAENAKDNNYLTAIMSQDDGESYDLAYVDLATGQLQVTTLASFDELTNEIINLQTKETVLPAEINLEVTELLNKLGILISHNANQEVNSATSYLSQNIDSEGQKAVLAQLLEYVRATQKRSLDHLKKAVAYEPNYFLEIDHNSQYNLELTKNIRTAKKSGTLLWLLDQTKTAMGGRKLKQWVERPLISRDAISKRQEVVEDLLNHYYERNQLTDDLIKVYDLERLASRIAFGSVNGRDLIQLKTSLEQMPKIRHALDSFTATSLKKLSRNIISVDDLVDLIEQAIADEPPISVTEGGIIKDDYDKQLDAYRDASKNGKQWLANLEAQEREITGINNLKIGFNRVFGYYIEVTKANSSKVPTERYQRKQTLTNSERLLLRS